MGWRLSGSDVAVGFAATVTWNDCVCWVFVDGSVAVTVMTDVSPARAWVASMWTTPLGLVVDRVAVLMLIGLMGVDFSPPRPAFAIVATCVIWLTTFMPETTCPKFVKL